MQSLVFSILVTSSDIKMPYLMSATSQYSSSYITEDINVLLPIGPNTLEEIISIPDLQQTLMTRTYQTNWDNRKIRTQG